MNFVPMKQMEKYSALKCITLKCDKIKAVERKRRAKRLGRCTCSHCPFTHLQSPHNQPTYISPPAHLCSTSSQHSLFSSGYPRSTTNIILATCNWSL